LTAPACAEGSGVRLVAVAVMIWPPLTFALSLTEKEAKPLALVVTLAAPRKVWPSGRPPSGSGVLTKNSMRNMVLGEARCVSVPVMVTLPPETDTAVNRGKFWKLLGSLAAPWPLESLGVTPSSLGKTKAVERSMPIRDVGLLRPFWKIELPRMELP